MEKARRYKTPLTLCFLDLDGLKSVNDNLGHEAGDELIKSFASAVRGAIRSEDAAFRFGGDEFVLIFSCDPERAKTVVSRITKATEKFNAEKGREWRLGFSHGLAVFDAGARLSAEEFIGKADEEMYAEKAEHRLAGKSPLREPRDQVS
jgi:diguanylate cyclase (GGDEF)-like protein